MKELAEWKDFSRAQMRNLPEYFSESSSEHIEAGESRGARISTEKNTHTLRKKEKLVKSTWQYVAYPVFVGIVAVGCFYFFSFFCLIKLKKCRIIG